MSRNSYHRYARGYDTSKEEFEDSQSVSVNIKSETTKSKEKDNGFDSNDNKQPYNNNENLKEKRQLIFKNPFIKPRKHSDFCWQWRKSLQASKSSTESLIHVLKWLPCDKCYNFNTCNNSKNNSKDDGNDRSCSSVLWDMLAKNVIKFGCPRHDLYDTLRKKFGYYCNERSMEDFIFCNGYSPGCKKSHPILKVEGKDENITNISNKNPGKNAQFSGRWLNVCGKQKRFCLNCGDGQNNNKNNQLLLYEYKRWSLDDIGVKIDENMEIDVQYNYLKIGTSTSINDTRIHKSSISILINRAANNPFMRKMRPGLWKYTKHLQCLGSWVCLF